MAWLRYCTHVGALELVNMLWLLVTRQTVEKWERLFALNIILQSRSLHRQVIRRVPCPHETSPARLTKRGRAPAGMPAMYNNGNQNLRQQQVQTFNAFHHDQLSGRASPAGSLSAPSPHVISGAQPRPGQIGQQQIAANGHARAGAYLDTCIK